MVDEIKVEHVLILAIVVFLLYHFIGRCRCNGFRVGGNEKFNILSGATDKLCKKKIDKAVAAESERGEQRRRETIMVFEDEMEVCRKELEFMNETWAPEVEKQINELHELRWIAEREGLAAWDQCWEDCEEVKKKQKIAMTEECDKELAVVKREARSVGDRPQADAGYGRDTAPDRGPNHPPDVRQDVPPHQRDTRVV